MSGVNCVHLIGNLGKAPEVKFLPSGKAVAKFPLAISRSWKDDSGQKQERTTWLDIVVFGKQAETVGTYCDKGKQVYVQGEIQTRTYDDKDGNKRYVTEIVADKIQFLGGNRSEQQSNNLDDIPF